VTDRPRCTLDREATPPTLRLAGDWRLGSVVEGAGPALAAAADPGLPHLRLEAGGLGGWDTSLPVFVRRLQAARPASTALALDGLPQGARRLLELAATPLAETTGPLARPSFLARIGEGAQWRLEGVADVLAFVGEVVLGLGRLLSGRSVVRGRDLALAIEEAGVRALPIVTLVSILIGVVLAFVGASQLRLFGAEIFVANLVAVGMLREMGAMMPAIVAAGRSGAAYAAEIGSMVVEEELDALRTMAIDPIDFLVLPRILAMTAMLPLLAVYANVLGILGGGLTAWALFGIEPRLYLDQARLFLGLDALASGLFKAAVFGAIVAATGCYRGLRCGRDAAAVGRATTAAVVGGIVGIVVADSFLTVIYHVLGI